MWKLLSCPLSLCIFVAIVHGDSSSETTTPSDSNLEVIQLVTATAGIWEDCDENVQCLKQAGLVCNDEICKCADNLKYENGRRACVTLVGHKCKVNAKDNTTQQITNIEGNEGPTLLDCMDSSYCSSEGVCKCEPNFYQDDYGSCTKKKGLESYCRSEEECDSNKMLACVKYRCNCFAKEEMYFDHSTDSCRIKVGRNCRDIHSGYQNTTRISFKMTSKKVNELTIDQEKEREELLWSQIMQAYSSAQCPTDSFCNATTGKCDFLFNATTGEYSCPLDQYMDLVSSTCELIKSKGEPCSVKKECDSKKFLSCVDGKCDCDPDLTIKNRNNIYVRNPAPYHSSIPNDFIVRSGECLGKVGTSCSVKSRGRQDFYAVREPSPDNKYCIVDAECEPSEVGVCKCKGGLKITQDKMCGKKYNEDCSMDRVCADYLVCTDGKCLCPNKDYQIHGNKKTEDGCLGSCRDLGLVGTACIQPSVNDTSSCVKNADCTQDQFGRFSCSCKTGFVTNSTGQCDISYGFPCDNSIEGVYCDKKADLSCRIVRRLESNGNKSALVEICSCQNLDDVYDAELRKCVKAQIIFVECGVSRSNGTCSKIINPLNLHPQKGWCLRGNDTAPTP